MLAFGLRAGEAAKLTARICAAINPTRIYAAINLRKYCEETV